MAKKGYSTLPRHPEIKLHHQMQLSVIPSTSLFCGVLLHFMGNSRLILNPINRTSVLSESKDIYRNPSMQKTMLTYFWDKNGFSCNWNSLLWHIFFTTSIWYYMTSGCSQNWKMRWKIYSVLLILKLLRAIKSKIIQKHFLNERK